MNRLERRRTGMKTKEPVINMKRSDIKKMKDDITSKAIDAAFLLMLAIPVMVIHYKYGQLMRKDGREERFTDLCLEMYDGFDKGYFTLEEAAQCLYEETGVRIEERLI